VRTAAYLGAAFGSGVFASFNNFTLSLWLAQLTTSYLVIGLLGNTRSFEGALVSPLAGALSDRTWLGWLGRRRPFMLVGGLAAAALLAATPFIARVGGEGTRLGPAIVAIFLFTLAYNTMDDVHQALLVDLTEGAARTRLAALRLLVDMSGQVTILVVGLLLWQDAIPDLAFLVAGALLAIGVLVTVLGVREPDVLPDGDGAAEPSAPGGPVGRSTGRVAGAIVAARAVAREHRAAATLLLVQLAYWAGVSAVLPLVSVYTRDILGATVGEAQLLPALLLLSTTLLAWPMAWLGNRHGKRRTIAGGLVVMGLAALSGLIITTKSEGAIVFLLAGVGNAAILVLIVPLLAELVPRSRMGAATGLLAAAGSAAAPAASLVGGALADLFGPRAIFGLMAVMVFVALALLPGTRAANR